MDNLNIGINTAKDHNTTFTEDITIDIFSESMTEYLQKLKKASAGRYELDHDDSQMVYRSLANICTNTKNRDVGITELARLSMMLKILISNVSAP